MTPEQAVTRLSEICVHLDACEVALRATDPDEAQALVGARKIIAACGEDVGARMRYDQFRP